jgi:hypothetical protein
MVDYFLSGVVEAGFGLLAEAVEVDPAGFASPLPPSLAEGFLFL